jgi:uncharacterized phiE125 gp8 family phage protein
VDLIAAPSSEPVTLGFVRDQHLRAASENAEDEFIQHVITVSRREGERITRRSWVEQTRRLVQDGFSAELLLTWPPVLEVASVTYVDEDGATQTMDPSAYQVSLPTGPYAGCGRIRPAYDTTWPTTRAQMDAVTVTYTAGYRDDTVSPPIVSVPADLIHGMLLMVGELYKLRSLSVHTMSQNPAIVQARSIWMGYRVYQVK